MRACTSTLLCYTSCCSESPRAIGKKVYSLFTEHAGSWTPALVADTEEHYKFHAKVCGAHGKLIYTELFEKCFLTTHYLSTLGKSTTEESSHGGEESFVKNNKSALRAVAR